uniref:general transcription factor 3C polypeptide 6 isoform X2 n=1 Tax=Semicossyphus pulcher TaxID=241346 RepID=UPI0037E8C83F
MIIVNIPLYSRTIIMDDEWEEEEQLVVVELSGIINNDFLTKCRGTCKILDIDSEKPMMQVGQYVFAGEYEGKADSGPELKYMCHTVKKLMMQRIFLTEKKEGETSTGSGDKEDAACQKEHANQHGQTDEDMENTDLGDKAVG